MKNSSLLTSLPYKKTKWNLSDSKKVISDSNLSLQEEWKVLKMVNMWVNTKDYINVFFLSSSVIKRIELYITIVLSYSASYIHCHTHVFDSSTKEWRGKDRVKFPYFVRISIILKLNMRSYDAHCDL